MPPCHGRLRKCHLISQQELKKTKAYRAGELDLWDPRLWVWGCGGIMGNGGHHHHLDSSRKLKLPRTAIPAPTEALADELGLGWFLEREYGS